MTYKRERGPKSWTQADKSITLVGRLTKSFQRKGCLPEELSQVRDHHQIVAGFRDESLADTWILSAPPNDSYAKGWVTRQRCYSDDVEEMGWVRGS